MEKFQRAKEGLLDLESHDSPSDSSEEEQMSQLLESLQSIRRNTGHLDESSDNDNDNDNGGSMIRTSMRYNNKFEKVTLRTLLQSKSDISRLIESLSTLVSHRNVNYNDDNDDDIEDESNFNQENNQGNEWTLSSKALMAGRSYIELSSMEGSWGAGWIDVGVMRNIEALIRRWGEECRGKTLKRNKVKRGRGSGASGEHGVNKRKRNDDNDNGDHQMKSKKEEYGDEDYVEALKTNNSVMIRGLQLAKAISDVVSCQDYWNWNKDARGAIMDAAISALGITSALVASFDCDESGDYNTIGASMKFMDEVDCCARVVASLETAIEYCITNNIESHTGQKRGRGQNRLGVNSYLLGIEEDGPSMSVAATADPKETAVVFLRASYPFLTCQIDLPNGSKGRTFACRNTSNLVVKILKMLSLRVQATENLRSTVLNSVQKTPANKGSQESTMSSLKTPRSILKGMASGRKTPRSRRKSLDGALMVPPSLKKNATPKSSRRQSLGAQNRTIVDIFVGLMQKISTSKGMEKADVRGRIAAFLKKCMDVLPDSHRSIFLRSVIQFCRSKVSTHRIFGVDLIGSFLLTEWMWSGNLSTMSDTLSGKRSTSTCNGQGAKEIGGESEFPSDSAVCFLAEESLMSSEIMSTLRGRLSDRVPAVRVRAAAALSTAMKGITEVGNSQVQMGFQQCISNFKVALLPSLRERANTDEKATVRRAAIIALADLLFVLHEPPDELDIAVLSQMCNDASVAVRKSAVDAIVSLIDRHHSSECSPEAIQVLEVAWVDFVLPLVNDGENSCSVKAIESFLELIIDPIVESAQNSNGDSSSNIKYQSTWHMLSRINVASSSAGSFKGGKNALNTAFKKAFETSGVSHQREVAVALLSELHGNISDEDAGKKLNDRTIGSWCLLECMTSLGTHNGPDSFDLKAEIMQSGIGTDFLLNYWNYILRVRDESDGRREKTTFTATARCCLHVISALASIMTYDEANDLFTSLRASIESFSLGIDVIGASISALFQITQRLHDDGQTKENEAACKEWIISSLQSCETMLRKFVAPAGSLYQHLDRVLYTVGELTMVGFDPSQDTYHERLSVLEASSKDGSLRSLSVKPSSTLFHLVQSLLLPTLPKENDTANETRVPHKLRAHAFITFGKMCLRDEALTKKSVNFFARELRQEGNDSDPAVKSNALVVLGDFCIRYTHHVDKFISLMASCLQPTHEYTGHDNSESIVRHHAIRILSNLILQDYIKWKGVLFYRFLAATVDEDPSVANLAKLLLCGPLVTKQPTLFFNNFVDSLFILNGCTAHPMFANREMRDSQSFQTDGLNYFRIENSAKRNDIYNLLLSHMSDEEKIGITARLSKEVLSTATEMKGDLRSAANTSSQDARIGGAYSVLSDCFQILTSPKMRIGRAQHANEDADMSTATVSAGPTASLLSSAKGKLLSKISRKHLMETVLPILCSLKTILEKSRSPLLRNLMQYMVFIFRQFKKEVNETLVSNQTLLQEIQYDTRQFEKSQKKNENQLQSVEIIVA